VPDQKSTSCQAAIAALKKLTLREKRKKRKGRVSHTGGVGGEGRHGDGPPVVGGEGVPPVPQNTPPPPLPDPPPQVLATHCIDGREKKGKWASLRRKIN